MSVRPKTIPKKNEQLFLFPEDDFESAINRLSNECGKPDTLIMGKETYINFLVIMGGYTKKQAEKEYKKLYK